MSTQEKKTYKAPSSFIDLLFIRMKGSSISILLFTIGYLLFNLWNSFPPGTKERLLEIPFPKTTDNQPIDTISQKDTIWLTKQPDEVIIPPSKENRSRKKKQPKRLPHQEPNPEVLPKVVPIDIGNSDQYTQDFWASLNGHWKAVLNQSIKVHKTASSNTKNLAQVFSITSLEAEQALIENFNPISSVTFGRATHIFADGSQLQSLEHINSFPALGYLSINNTQVRDLTPLIGIKNLHSLSIKNCPVTNTSLNQLRQAKPNLTINL